MSAIWISCLALVFLSGYSLGQIETNGASGELCGHAPYNKKCILGQSTCNMTTGECDCNDNYDFGNGKRLCYKKSHFRTEVFSDPTVLTYNGVFVGLPLPCRYKWTHTKTYLKDRNRKRVGYCYFEAYATHNKDKGKIFKTGFDVAIKIAYDNGVNETLSVRKYGKASDGTYMYDVNATIGDYRPHGMWDAWDEEDTTLYYNDPTNLRISCTTDEVNNLFKLTAKKCGIQITMRGYDCVKRRKQPQVPYLSYAVNCAFHPTFLDQDNVVAIAPEEHGGETIYSLKPADLTKEEYMVYRALNSGAVQNGPKYPNPQCDTAASSLNACSEATRNTALKSCMWILEYPRFIHCMDKTNSGADIMKLYSECVDIFCSGGSCAALKSKIVTAQCNAFDGPPQPGFDSFMAGLYC